MKVPPKRKGNPQKKLTIIVKTLTLNESPSEKEGKSGAGADGEAFFTLNESPSEKEGKLSSQHQSCPAGSALNESPSEKEGKFEFSCA